MLTSATLLLLTTCQVKGYIVLRNNEWTSETLNKKFNALKTLVHGEHCSTASHKYVEYLSASYDNLNETKALEIMNDIVLDGAQLCDDSKLLVCSTERHKCICGNIWTELGTSHLQLVREGDGCAIALEATCYIDEGRCATGLACVVDSKPSLSCIKENIMIHIDGDRVQSCSCQFPNIPTTTGYNEEEDKSQDNDEEDQYTAYDRSKFVNRNYADNDADVDGIGKQENSESEDGSGKDTKNGQNDDAESKQGEHDENGDEIEKQAEDDKNGDEIETQAEYDKNEKQSENVENNDESNVNNEENKKNHQNDENEKHDKNYENNENGSLDENDETNDDNLYQYKYNDTDEDNERHTTLNKRQVAVHNDRKYGEQNDDFLNYEPAVGLARKWNHNQSSKVIYAEIEERMRDLTKLSQLGLGDHCSIYAENLRHQFIKAYFKMHTDENKISKKALRHTLKQIDTLVANGEPVCQSNSLLTCDLQTKTCQCGEVAYRVLEVPLPRYVIWDNQCFLAKGEACLYSCESGTTCLGSDGMNCVSSMSAYSDILTYLDSGVTVGDVFLGLVKGDVCKCNIATPFAREV